MAIFDPLQNRHPLTDRQKFVTGDYVGDRYNFANLVHIRPRGEGFWSNGCLYVSFGQGSSLLWTHTLSTLRPL